MSAIGDLVATLGMDTSPFAAASGRAQQMASAMADSIGQATGRVRGAMSSVLSGIGLGSLGGLVAGGALVTGLYECVHAAQEAGREQKRLGVLLDSTGAGAVISAGQIGELGARLQKTTNFSREMTVAAAGALAPFSKGM